MLRAGVSTACLYPRVVEEALYDLALSGVSHVEIFINSHSNYAAALWIRWHGCYSGLT